MRKIKLFVATGACVGIGLCAGWWARSFTLGDRTMAIKVTSPPLKERVVKEEFVPAQQLRIIGGLTDPAAAIDVASVDVWEDSIVFHSTYQRSSPYNGIAANVYASGDHTAIELGGQWIRLDNTGFSIPGRQGGRGLLFQQWIHTKGIPQGSSKHFDADDVLPNEDLRLRHPKGWLFASIGLTASGDPGIAFADRNGAVRMMWVQRSHFGPEWWNVGMWDASGRLRLDLELKPGEVPNLVMFPDDTGQQYFLDSKLSALQKLENQAQGALFWMPKVTVTAATPLRLLDLRGRTLWHAPAGVKF